MPEREFIGMWSDCRQRTDIPLLLRWDIKPFLKADRNSPLVEWIVAHHAEAPRSTCNLIRLLTADGKNVDVGYVEVIRSEEFYNSHRSKDIAVSDFCFE